MKDYIRLILIAFVIALPLTISLITEWMSSFAYRMEIKWYYFAIPGILALFLGLLTVAIQAFKSAQANPVIALNRE